MGRMSHICGLWGRFLPGHGITAERCERKSRTHSYDDLVNLLFELPMERENDSNVDKYLRKHLRRETPAEKSPGGRSPQPHSNPESALVRS